MKMRLAGVAMLCGMLALTGLGGGTPAHALCAAPKTMTGTWRANDGGTYYVRQAGFQVLWLGENKKAGFTNVFHGMRNGNSVTGVWADIKGGTGGGSLALTLSGTNAVTGWKQKSSNGFAGTVWFQPCDDTGMNPVD